MSDNQLLIIWLDGGYFTGPESFYETPDTSRTAEEEGTGRTRELYRKESFCGRGLEYILGAENRQD
jgi:hypothetical protein